MKKHSGSQSRNTQSETVRRAQEAGRRQAALGAKRTLQGSDNRSDDAGDTYPGGDVSIEVPYRMRRTIVLGIVILGVLLIAYAVVVNLPNWQQFHIADNPAAVSNQMVTATPDFTNRIGLVSGHRGNDSGSVCQDGLTEAQVNFDTAVRVAELLRAQGYMVDILDEFDPRLKGYRARLLLSIHADSCTYINDLATGFKVARVLDSQSPSADDRLVACLTTKYKQSTGLRFHANTVTYDMTKYHAFYEVDANTPAAIIETGFLYMDRQLLTNKPELVTQGIYDGLICFLKGEDPKTP
jgi:N-acetylmuramoyl-L-alanine amidase